MKFSNKSWAARKISNNIQENISPQKIGRSVSSDVKITATSVLINLEDIVN